MIDLSQETPISISQSPRKFPSRPHVSTVWRWVKIGVRGVQLETFVVGARRYTTHESITRFVAATTAAADGLPSPTRTSRQRQRDIERAEAELAKAGI